MMQFNHNMYTRFVKFGQVASEQERLKMVDIIQEWQYTPIEESNIDRKYLDSINIYITDDTINSMLAVYPNLQDEFTQKLFDLLVKVDGEIANKATFSEELKLIQEYSDCSITILKPAKAILNKSDVLDEQKITAYYSELNSLKSEKKHNALVELKDKLSEKWQGLIDRKNNSALAQQLQQSSRKSTQQQLKDSFDVLTTEQFTKKWSGQNKYQGFLKKNYSKKDFDIDSYNKQFEKIIKTNTEEPINPKKLATIKNKFIEDWQKKLSLAKLQQDIKIIDEARQVFLAELYAKIEELKELFKLLSPFIHETADVSRLWDMSTGNWQNVNFHLLEKYSQILKEKKEIQELAELLGKCRKAEAEIEEEEFENIITVSRYNIECNGRAELVGITESDDLNNLLPTELALFSDLETESIFYKRFAEKKLQTFQYIDKELSHEKKSINDTRQKEIEKDKGPFIIAVDTSGSMQGSPEFLAKVIAFAITKIAISEQRKAFLISFSTKIETFELTDIQNSLEKLIEFLQMSFYGGTDVSEAVEEALHQMETENYEQADLLIISDGVFGNLTEETLEDIEVLKEKGNKFNSLMIGNSYNKRALSFCNNIWQYNPQYDDMKNLIRNIKEGI